MRLLFAAVVLILSSNSLQPDLMMIADNDSARPSIYSYSDYQQGDFTPQGDFTQYCMKQLVPNKPNLYHMGPPPAWIWLTECVLGNMGRVTVPELLPWDSMTYN
jgi:hypothetical protein